MDIRRPTLLLDEQKCRSNIKMMANKARRAGLIFRPHFKTHQSRAVGRWFRDFGVEKITVSSVQMARYFADAGFGDITIAFPVNLGEIAEIDRLAGEIELNCLIEARETARVLDLGLQSRIGAFVKIDTGYHRTGIDASDIETIEDLLGFLGQSAHIAFKGFLTHAGHSYHARDRGEILSIHAQSLRAMNALKETFRGNRPELILSHGDTPCCSAALDFVGADEIRPGNFVFFDWMQHELGSCDPGDIAIAVACPVVAKHEQRAEIVIYGGAVHFSKEHLTTSAGKTYGAVVPLDEHGWGPPLIDAGVSSLSQEHGIVTLPPEELKRIEVGDVIGILPVHACLTANLIRGYQTLDGQLLDHLSGSPQLD